MSSHEQPSPAPVALTAVPSVGDRAEAERLVEESYRTIYRALYRMCGNADEAADLTQETYRRAWAAIGSFQGRCAFTTWLYRIAYTTFLNHRRRPQPEPLEDDGAALEAPAPHAAPGSTADEPALRRAVLALPAELRFVVTAHYWAERPVSEIAKEEGCSTVAIRKRLKKAMDLLAADLGVTRR